MTRRPEDYSDAKALPHVSVALRAKKRGKTDAELVNSFIPYVICKPIVEQGKKANIGDMSYSPEEYMEYVTALVVDGASIPLKTKAGISEPELCL